MWADQFTAPAVTRPPPKPAEAQARPIREQMEGLLKLVDAMLKRVMPDGKRMAEDVPVREGKETVTALTSMFSTVMRHYEVLREQEENDIFRQAVTNVLTNMDEDTGSHFLAALHEELARLEGDSKLSN